MIPIPFYLQMSESILPVSPSPAAGGCKAPIASSVPFADKQMNAPASETCRLFETPRALSMQEYEGPRPLPGLSTMRDCWFSSAGNPEKPCVRSNRLLPILHLQSKHRLRLIRYSENKEIQSAGLAQKAVFPAIDPSEPDTSTMLHILRRAVVTKSSFSVASIRSRAAR